LLNPGERFTERYVKKTDKIIIPDNPLPYTLCEYNLGSLESVGIADKTEFVGSFFDTSPTEGSEKHVFAPISGPFGTRAKLLQLLLPTFKELGVKSIISLGVPGERKTVKLGNCEVHSWLSAQERIECMRNAKLVVFSGGHITCFETVKYAKPSICLPTQPEQLANAAKLETLSCGLVARNRQQLAAAVRRIEKNYALFKGSVERLNRFSNRFHGLNRAVDIVEALARQ
jgi:UDP:flavonoid glycosyltransferase YjiC (YdhE family)